MDEMRIKLSTRFMKGMIAKIIMKIIHKKYGYDIDIRLNELSIDVIDGIAHLHVSTDIDINQDELKTIIKDIGSDEEL